MRRAGARGAWWAGLGRGTPTYGVMWATGVLYWALPRVQERKEGPADPGCYGVGAGGRGVLCRPASHQTEGAESCPQYFGLNSHGIRSSARRLGQRRADGINGGGGIVMGDWMARWLDGGSNSSQNMKLPAMASSAFQAPSPIDNEGLRGVVKEGKKIATTGRGLFPQLPLFWDERPVQKRAARHAYSVP